MYIDIVGVKPRRTVPVGKNEILKRKKERRRYRCYHVFFFFFFFFF